ncbi:MAG: 4Fe-4S binding protein [Zoogloeaceae bacterium]|nr:4Fe-4S binding protein [Zoogloeaceae bacterium]
MITIEKKLCTGCKTCLLFCPDEAIDYRDGKCFVDQTVCTQCGVCLENCAAQAIRFTPDTEELKIFQRAISNPGAGTTVTGGNSGRGGHEVKTLDVVPRQKNDEITINLDIGRPGVGVYLRDAERIVLALLEAGMKFLPGEDFPLATIIPDRKTGRFRPDCLDMHLHTLLVEGIFKQDKLPDIIRALQRVEKDIDTVICVGLVMPVDKNCRNSALDCLDTLGLPRPHRGKVNVGLGRPYPPDLSALPLP